MVPGEDSVSGVTKNVRHSIKLKEKKRIIVHRQPTGQNTEKMAKNN